MSQAYSAYQRYSSASQNHY